MNIDQIRKMEDDAIHLGKFKGVQEFIKILRGKMDSTTLMNAYELFLLDNPPNNKSEAA